MLVSVMSRDRLVIFAYRSVVCSWRQASSFMDDKLYFYSKSRDVYPGKGTNEVVAQPNDYLMLSQIPNWRRILSNFSDDCIIKHDGSTYRTIEHAFQSEKIRLVDRLAAHQFALESESVLSRGTRADAQKQRKLRFLTEAQLRIWERDQTPLLIELWLCKVSNSPLFRGVLVATNNAELWHVQYRKPAVRWKDLEAVRSELQRLRDEA